MHYFSSITKLFSNISKGRQHGFFHICNAIMSGEEGNLKYIVPIEFTEGI